MLETGQEGGKARDGGCGGHGHADFGRREPESRS